MRLLTALLSAALLYTAFAINFSQIHLTHNSDSVLLAFISIDRWMPFYWADNRYGMPIAFLASWIRDYRWNLLFQSQIYVSAAVGLVCLANLFFFHSAGAPVTTRLGAACISLPLLYTAYQWTPRVLQTHLQAHPYVLSLFFVIAAIVLTLRVRGNPALRVSAAMTLMTLGLWVNYSHVIPGCLLLAILPVPERTWKKTIGVRAVSVLGTVLIFTVLRIWASHYPTIGGGVGFVAASEWGHTANRLAEMTLESIIRPFAFGVIVLAAPLAWIAGRRFGWLQAPDAVILTGTALVFALAVCTTDWPARNTYEPRFWTTPLALLLLVACAGVARLILEGVRSITGSYEISLAVAALLVVAATNGVFGFPSAKQALSALDQATGKFVGSAGRLGCTHMLGHYWTAWITVFHARAHNQTPRYALTFRADVMGDDWNRVPPSDRRYCVICQLPDVKREWQKEFGLPPLRETGTDGELCRLEH